MINPFQYGGVVADDAFCNRRSELTDIQRAVRYFYLLKAAFGGSALFKSTFGYQTTGPPRLNLVTLEEVILQIHLRLLRVTVECLDSKDCIKRYDRPHTVFYLDPPYYGTKDYAHNFEKEDYISLAETLQGIQGKFLLSLNDVPFIQAIFKEFTSRSLELRYSRARKESSRAHLRGELLISNF